MSPILQSYIQLQEQFSLLIIDGKVWIGKCANFSLVYRSEIDNVQFRNSKRMFCSVAINYSTTFVLFCWRSNISPSSKRISDFRKSLTGFVYFFFSPAQLGISARFAQRFYILFCRSESKVLYWTNSVSKCVGELFARNVLYRDSLISWTKSNLCCFPIYFIISES